MGITRRRLLVSGLGAATTLVTGGALVQNDVLPGRVPLYAALGLNGEAGAVPDVAGTEVERGSVDGARWWVSRPTVERANTPVVIALHGARSDAEGWLTKLAIDKFHAVSGAGFAIAAIDGGEHDYWHPRASGRDPRGRVIDRFLPLLARRGLDVARPGFLGWSMGGYGALLLASEVEAGPVVAVSPALWDEWDDTAPGAYDDRSAFARWRVLGNRDRLARLADLDVRVDCGRGDPFVPGVEDLREQLPSAEVHLGAGDHRAGYWRRVLPAQLAWLDERL